MATTPRYQQRTSTPGPASTERVRAPNIDPGAGRALASVGQGLIDVAGVVQEQRVRSLYQAAETNISQQKSHEVQRLRELEKLPVGDVDKAAEKLLSDSRTAWSAVRTSAGKEGDGIRHTVDLMVDGHMREIEDRISNVRATAHGSLVAEKFETSISDRARGVEADPSTFERADAELSFNIQHALIEPRAQIAMRMHGRNQLALAALRGAMARDPAGVAEQLKSENPDAGYIRALDPQMRSDALVLAERQVRNGTVNQWTNLIAGKFRKQGMHAGARAMQEFEKLDLPEDIKDDVRSDVRTSNELLRDERRQEFLPHITELSEQIAYGRVPANAEQTAYLLYRRGALSEGQFIDARESIARVRADAANKLADREALAAMLQAGQPLDPSDPIAKKAVSTEFEAITNGVNGRLSISPAQNFPEYQQVAVNLAKRHGVLPEPAVSYARAALLSDDPALAVRGASLLARMEEAAPRSYSYAVDERTRAIVAQIVEPMRAGLPDTAAVLVARKNAERPEAEMDLLRKRYSAGKFAEGNDSSLAGMLDSDDRYDHALLGGAPSAPPALQAEFDNGVRRYFEYSGGNIETARKLAFADVRRKWAYSEINGAPELIPFAPEAMWGVTRAMVQSDLQHAIESDPTKLRRLDSDSGQAVDAALTADQLRLVQTDETARTNGLSWAVGYESAPGVIEVLRKPDNRPLTYRLPVAPEDLKRLREQKAAQEISRAKKRAEEQRRYIEVLEERARAGDDEAFNALMFAPKPAPGAGRRQ